MILDKDTEDQMAERKRNRTIDRYPHISYAEMQELIYGDPVFLEMERRLKAIEELSL